MAKKNTETVIDVTPVTVSIVRNEPLSVAEANGFIKIATEICFDDNGDYIEFMWQLNIFYAVLLYYTDYNPVEKSFDEVYKLYYSKESEPVRELIKQAKLSYDNILTNQLDDIVHITNNIVYKRIQKHERPVNIGEAIMDYLSGKYSPVIAGIVETLAENPEIVDELSEKVTQPDKKE